MKRFALIALFVGAFALSTSNITRAADAYHGHGFVGGHGYVGGHAYSRHGRHGFGDGISHYGGHGYVATGFGHGVRRGHTYVSPSYGNHGYYPSYGHGRGVRISTPHFGLRIGH